MNRAIYEIASSGVAAQTRLDTVAENLANARTPGYKASRVSFAATMLQNFARAPRGGGPQALAPTPQVIVPVQTIDFAPGAITTTGNPLDVAIEGPGFLTVNTAAGERYTRQGSLRTDASGYLVTLSGDRVQGGSGDIRLGEGAVEIAEDGSVVVDGKATDRLKLVTFGDPPTGLVAEGGSRYAAAAGAAPTPLEANQVHVAPRALEQANTDAVGGLVALVDVSRAYETYMRAIQRLDEVAKKAIDEVGRV